MAHTHTHTQWNCGENSKVAIKCYVYATRYGKARRLCVKRDPSWVAAACSCFSFRLFGQFECENVVERFPRFASCCCCCCSASCCCCCCYCSLVYTQAQALTLGCNVQAHGTKRIAQPQGCHCHGGKRSRGEGTKGLYPKVYSPRYYSWHNA